MFSFDRLDFQHGEKSEEQLPQRLSPRVRQRAAHQEDQFQKQKWTSDYKMFFQHGQPNPRINTDFNTGREYDGSERNNRTYHDVNATGKIRKVIPHYLAHTEAVKRRVKSAPLMRLGVEDCMSWPTEQLNHSIPIPNRYDKKSLTYKFRNPFAPKLARKWRDSKPPTKEQLLKPEPYHWREKVHLRPPAAQNRANADRATSTTASASTMPIHSDVTSTRPPSTSREAVTPTPVTVTPRPPEVPRSESSFRSCRGATSMTPAATPVTCFGPPTWVTQPIPTVVVN